MCPGHTTGHTAAGWDLWQETPENILGPTWLPHLLGPEQWHFQSEHEPGERSPSGGQVASGTHAHTSLSAEGRNAMIVLKAILKEGLTARVKNIQKKKKKGVVN